MHSKENILVALWRMDWRVCTHLGRLVRRLLDILGGMSLGKNQ